MARWEVVLVAEVAAWFDGLVRADDGSAHQVEDAIDALSYFGPALAGLSSTGSKVRNSTI
ncbi:hypothetical protein [Streptomyces sp. B21-101]|uniref:hypothetical protein n=1 Tax=Streptomyces sp. B21-101 TaxID=3039415 RepID=UPI003FA7C8EA